MVFNIVKWWIDFGLDGDVYVDCFYMYGLVLSFFNCFYVGIGEYSYEKGGFWFEEGGDEEGMWIRKEVGVFGIFKGCMKWVLGNQVKEDWVFEYGKMYGMDFYNLYIDFMNFVLCLLGFYFFIVCYWDGQGFRYVLCDVFFDFLFV